MRIAVIGSGLAAVAACKSLIARGVKPVVFDVGKTLDSGRAEIVRKLSLLDPGQWPQADIDLIAQNPTISNKDEFPRKLSFGSSYFYGQSCDDALIESSDELPPFSYAKGGFSVAWGACVLPPDDCDLSDWPIGNGELKKYYSTVLDGLPYSAADDGLSLNFPLISSPGNPVRLSRGNESLLHNLNASGLLARDKLVFGRSRLLASAGEAGDGCRNCGYCMSGCVYGSIYKASQDIDRMIAAGAIEYRGGMLVNKLEEDSNSVRVSFVDENKQPQSLSFDRVFVAAGAVNSTRIVLQSKQLYEQKIPLKTTLSFIAPIFRIKRSPLEWPGINTSPGIFLDFKVAGLHDHWVHTQLSTPNELVLEKLGLFHKEDGVLYRAKQRMVEHLLMAHCNMHSSLSSEITLCLTRTANGNDKLISKRNPTEEERQAIKKAAWKLFGIVRQVGCYLAIPLIQDAIQSGGYHMGGSLPMRRHPEKATETDCWGSPKGWKRIHVVDSSVFSSIPGTTIGLLAMANSARIASEVEL